MKSLLSPLLLGRKDEQLRFEEAPILMNMMQNSNTNLKCAVHAVRELIYQILISLSDAKGNIKKSKHNSHDFISNILNRFIPYSSPDCPSRNSSGNSLALPVACYAYLAEWEIASRPLDSLTFRRTWSPRGSRSWSSSGRSLPSQRPARRSRSWPRRPRSRWRRPLLVSLSLPGRTSSQSENGKNV